MTPKKKYRLLVADIDGTLLDGNGTVSAEDIQAINEARQAGVRVCLSSGRALMACLDVLNQLSLDSYHIFFDGALVSTPDLRQEVYARPISETVVTSMIDTARAFGVDLELYTAGEYFIERETWSTQAHRDFFGIEPAMEDFDTIARRKRIIKGLAAITNPDEDKKVRLFWREMGDKLHFSEARTPAYPRVTFINILASETSKGVALEALAAYLGVPLDEVVAVGDGSNDISLLSSAGLGIAMGNALSEVKAVADYVTLDVKHSGLAAAVRKFLL